MFYQNFELNSREIATLGWLSGIFIAALIIPNVRNSFYGVLRAFLQRRILQVMGFFIAYIGSMIWVLYSIRIWDWDQLKNTVIWTLSVALIAVLRSNKISEDPKYFQKWVTQNFEVLAFIQFMVTLYTYPIWIEVLALPFFALMGGMIAVGGSDPKTRKTVSALSMILALFTLAFFGFAMMITIRDFWNYATPQTWRDFYIPIIMTILFLPFIFGLYIIISYQEAFVGLRYSIEDKRVRRLAQWRAIFAFGPKVELLSRWKRYVAMHRPKTSNDIKESIQEVKEAREREIYNPAVAIELGWSPNTSRTFLSNFGLLTRDYYRSYEENWCANSSIIEVGGGIFKNNIAYYIEGNKDAVTTLKLKLNINNPEAAEGAEAYFREVGETLIKNSINTTIQWQREKDMNLNVGQYRIQVIKNEWLRGIAGGYDRVLTISI